MTSTAPAPTGEVFGTPRALLRVEGAVVLAAAVSAYSTMNHSWWLFAALFLVPDLSMLGYLVNTRFGAAIYNAGHSYILPGALGAWGVVSASTFATALALIWIAHIGFDRMVGYGFKYADAFKHTHLGIPKWGRVPATK